MRMALSLIFVLFLTACGGNPVWLPRAHKISVQQGNLLNEQQLERVEIGMNRDLVRSIIGTPVVDSPFQNERWDYLYTKAPAGTSIKARRVSISFKDNLVTRIDSNQNAESGVVLQKRYWWERGAD